jgi:hypothetical protein
VVCSCEDDNEHSGSIKVGEILGRLRVHRLLKEESFFSMELGSGIQTTQ